MIIIISVITLILLILGIVFYRKLKVSIPQPSYHGPYQSIPTIQLVHKHPEGWGSGAVIKTIKSEPSQHTCSLIVENLQKYGCAIVENLYEELPVEKLGYEVDEIITKHTEEKVTSNTITATPGPFIDAVIHSLSNTLLKEMNIAYEKYHSENHEKTAYTHEPMSLCEFQGFNAKQLRLRLPGPGLSVHVDRASAKLTILYYLNECKGGEILLYLLPEEKRLTESPTIFEKDGGLCYMKDMIPVKIEPKLNRLVVFWSDSVPHEVFPILSNRLAFQVFISRKGDKVDNDNKVY